MSALEHVIPEGYKQTEVGLIPNDWFVKTFGQVMSIRHGKDQKAVQVPDGCYPIFGTGGKMGTTNTALYDKPSVLIGRKGTINKPRYIDKPFWTVDTLFYSVVSNSESAKFIYYKFCMIDWMQYNEASGVPSLNASTIESVSASFPELKEQTAIANALSDVDALISELEKLIAKKQAIKTATMQQLLTGRTRLPQFALREDGTPKGTKPSELGEIPEDWEVGFVGDVCDLLTGFPFPSSKYSDLGVRLLRGSNVKRSCTDWSEEITQYWPELTSSIAQYELKIGDIVISMDGSLVGRSFAQLRESDLPAVLLQRVARLRSEAVSQSYLKEWVCSKFFTEHCDSVKTVTAIPHISPQDIRSFKLLLPPSKEEQTAIATILSDMDEEIQALEQRLSKTRQIKQGMMQELLTGRTRLPFEKEQ
ncbi:restriction endonuclease subunit S [Shewanella algae]|uniref:restriction endonuclease subunit S n=1 Tax=Shewanella algae TaxID=38313 RepID=UPI003004D554